MLLRTRWLLSSLSLFPLPILTAQEGQEEKLRIEQQQNGGQGRREPIQKAGDSGDADVKDGADGVSAPRAAAAEALSNACSVIALVNPARLAAGETGTLTVVCALQHRAVILADAPWRVTYEPAQGAKKEVLLGAFALKPAGLGTLEERFKGKPVWDNQAQILIPISIAPGTPHGKIRVTVHVEVPLTDGSTGTQLGLFRGDPGIDVQVGAAMPRPVVRGAPAKSEAAGQSGPADVVAHAAVSEPSKAPKQTPTPNPVVPSGAPNGATQEPPVAKAAPAGGSPLIEPESGGESAPSATTFSMLPVALGGGVLLLLVLVLARKKS